MPKVCDNKSAGMIVPLWEHLLMIERRNYPEAYALPAGHLDGDTFPIAAVRECTEEAGLAVPMTKIQLVFSGTVPNPCKREGGSHHDWEVYRPTWRLPPTTAIKEGSDAKLVFWANKTVWQGWAHRTEYFMKKYNCRWTDVGTLTTKIFGDPKDKKTDPEWLAEMGLEPVWYYILRNAEFFNWDPPQTGD